jgi:hypothetical protein
MLSYFAYSNYFCYVADEAAFNGRIVAVGFGIGLFEQRKPCLVVVDTLSKLESSGPALPDLPVLLGVLTINIVPDLPLVNGFIVVGCTEVQLVVENALLQFPVCTNPVSIVIVLPLVR